MGKSRRKPNKPVQQIVKKDDAFLKPPPNPNTDLSNLINSIDPNNNNKSNPKDSLIIAQRLQAQIFSGPIPSPELMKGYEDVLPGSADRILTMAENTSKHNQEMEKMYLRGAISQSLRGQLFSFLIAIFGMGLGGVLIYLDKPIAGFVSIITALGTLAGVVWYQNFQKKKTQKEKEEKENISKNNNIQNNQNNRKK